MYPVHISNGFLFTPSLASLLLLMLLRFLDRQYAAVFQMADTCVSDAEPIVWRRHASSRSST